MKTYSLNLRQCAVMAGIALSGVGAIGTVAPANAELKFIFTPTATTPQAARDGFAAAGALWSSKFTDDVTININIDFAELSSGTLGQTSSTYQLFNYRQVYTAMSGELQSADDNAAFASLPNGSAVNSAFDILLNRTSNHPTSPGNATPYLDNDGDFNNRTINMSNANAKALGLINNGQASGNGDASIALSTLFDFDFNSNDGITAGYFDFVGVAAHEIGHALGFTSGVDVLDYFSQPVNGGPDPDDEFFDVNTLDLFRYSTASKEAGAIDWTADNRPKYFSLDRGTTSIAAFSNGLAYGDRVEAGHWKDNLGLGIMDSTIVPNEILTISENDLRAFDVIGWNRASVDATAVPEPADFIGTLFCAAITAELVFKRRKKLFQSTGKATDEVA